MPKTELKLSDLFAENFYKTPTKITEQEIKLNFPLPSGDIKQLNHFLQTQGRTASGRLEEKQANLTFYQGVNQLILQLQNWCLKHFSRTEFDVRQVLDVLRNYFEYDYDQTNKFFEKFLTLYKNGVNYLASVVRYIYSENISLDFRILVTRQLLEAFREEICPSGCNLNLYDAHLKFTQDIPTQIMRFRKKVSEDVMLKLLLQCEYITNKELIYQLHYAITPAVYYGDFINVGKEEKEDIYIGPVIKILESDTKITKEDMIKDKSYAVAKLVRDDFPTNITNGLTPEALVNHLKTLTLQIANKSNLNAEKQNEITLESTLENLIIASKTNAEMTTDEAEEHFKWICQRFEYFGKDNGFNRNTIFLSNQDVSEADEKIVYTQRLASRVVINHEICLSMLHRLESGKFITLASAVKYGTDDIVHLFPNNDLSLSYVTNEKKHTRLSFLHYVLEKTSADTSAECLIKLIEIMNELDKHNKNIELLNCLLEHLYYVTHPTLEENNLVDAIIKITQINKTYAETILSSHHPYNLLIITARYGKMNFFNSATNIMIENGIDTNYLLKAFNYPAHSHKVLYAATDNSHWDIVNYILEKYWFEGILAQSIMPVLTAAMAKNQIKTINAYFNLEEHTSLELKEAEKAEKTAKLYFNEKLRKHCDITSNYSDEFTKIRALVEVFQHKIEASEALEVMVKTIPTAHLKGMLKLTLNKQNFIEYCFSQKNIAVITSLEEKLLKKEIYDNLDKYREHLRVALNLKEHTQHVIYLLNINSDNEFRIERIIGDIPNEKYNDAIIETAIKILKKDALEKFITRIIIPIIIANNRSQLLKKIIADNKELQISKLLDTNILFKTIQTAKAWDCFLTLYESIPEIFQVEDELPFHAALDNRYDVTTRFYQANPVAVEEFFELYHADTKAYSATHPQNRTELYLLLDLCKYHCPYDFIKWQNLLHQLLEKLANQISEIALIKYSDDKLLLDYLFDPQLAKNIVPLLTHNTIVAADFLKFFEQSINDPTKESLCYTILLTNEHFFTELFSIDSPIKNEAIMLNLLSSLHESKTFPESARAIIKLHNQFNYTAVPKDLIILLFQKAVYLNQKDLLPEFFDSQSRNPIYNSKVNKSPTFAPDTNQNYILLFKCLDLLINKTNGARCCQFLLDAPANFYEFFIDRILLKRPHLRLELLKSHNEELLFVILEKASTALVKNFLLDTCIRNEFIGFLNRSNNKDRWLALIIHKAFFVLKDNVYKDGLTNLASMPGTCQQLPIALNLHANATEALQKNPVIAEQILNGCLLQVFQYSDNSYLNDFNLYIKKLIADYKPTPTPFGIVLLRVRAGLANKEMTDEKELCSIGNAIEKITKSDQLPLDLSLQIIDFYFTHCPNDTVRHVIYLRQLVHLAQNKYEPAEKKCLERLSSLLKEAVTLENILPSYEKALKILNEHKYILNFPEKVKKLQSWLDHKTRTISYIRFNYSSLDSKLLKFKLLFNEAQSDAEKKVIIYSMLDDSNIKNDIKKEMGFTSLESVSRLFEISIKIEISDNKWNEIKLVCLDSIKQMMGGEEKAEAGHTPLSPKSQMSFIKNLLLQPAAEVVKDTPEMKTSLTTTTPN